MAATILIPPLQHRNYTLIQDAGYVVTTKVDPKKYHEDNDLAENKWAAKWIAECFFSIVPTTPTTKAAAETKQRAVQGWGGFRPWCSKGNAAVPYSKIGAPQPAKKGTAVRLANRAGA